MKEIKTTIRVISSTGGIKIESSNTWINRSSTSRIHFTSEHKDMKGILFLNDKGYYEDFMPEDVAKERNENIEKLHKAVAKKFDAKSLDIHRQVALKCAVDYVKELSIKSNKQVLDTAEQFEEWLNR